MSLRFNYVKSIVANRTVQKFKILFVTQIILREITFLNVTNQ